MIDLDDEANEAVLTIHWLGGRHSETRVPRRRPGRYLSELKSDPVEVMRKLGGRLPDRELAVTMNRMRCRAEDGGTWTTVRARELRQRLGIASGSMSPRSTGLSAKASCRRHKSCRGLRGRSRSKRWRARQFGQACRKSSPPWHIAMPAGGGVHSIIIPPPLTHRDGVARDVHSIACLALDSHSTRPHYEHWVRRRNMIPSSASSITTATASDYDHTATFASSNTMLS